MSFRVHVRVMPRAGLLDPQGQAVEHALAALGFAEAGDVRVGRAIELDVAAPSRAEAEARARQMCDKLLAEGTVSCFCLAPSDNLALATAFVFNGFRRTGLLLGHMVVKGVRKDAIVWSRKLANPTEL